MSSSDQTERQATEQEIEEVSETDRCPKRVLAERLVEAIRAMPQGGIIVFSRGGQDT